MKNLRKNDNAITLIALVITIIILLILAGVTISTLTGENGLLERAIQTKEETQIAAAREKLELAIYNLIITKNGTAQLIDINEFDDRDSDNYSEDITLCNPVLEEDETAEVLVDGYIFTLNKELQIIEIKEDIIVPQIESYYKINSIQSDIANITIYISSNKKIEKVKMPENQEINVEKKDIAIDYDAILNQEYTFYIQLEGLEEEYKLKVDENNFPKIEDETISLYPTLTIEGVKMNNWLTIDYGDYKNNYYSLDNGNSWNVYQTAILVQKGDHILAKSVKENEITKLEEYTIDETEASDALPAECYDDNYETYIAETFAAHSSYTNYVYKMNIAEEVIGRNINLKISHSSSGDYSLRINYLNQEGEVISYEECQKTTLNISAKVPDGTKWIGISCSGGDIKIYEINLSLKPTILQSDGNTPIYPQLTSQGIRWESKDCEIFYDELCEQKMYKIDDEEWKEYKGKILLEKGQTLYAKGIVNGNDTEIASYYIPIASDVLPEICYDGDETTRQYIRYNVGSSFTNYTYKIKINQDLWENSIKIIASHSSSGNYSLRISFLNQEGEVISYEECQKTTLNTNVIVPSGTTSIGISCNGGNVYIYEINV